MSVTLNIILMSCEDLVLSNLRHGNCKTISMVLSNDVVQSL